MKRVSIPRTATLKDLYDIAYKTLNLLDYGFSLFSDRVCSKELRSSRSVSVTKSNLNHGDVIYYKQMAGSSVSSWTREKESLACSKDAELSALNLRKILVHLLSYFSRNRHRQVAVQVAALKLRFQLKKQFQHSLRIQLTPNCSS